MLKQQAVMTSIQDPVTSVVPPAALAALLLIASSVLQELGLPHPKTTEVLLALEVSRSRAYALRDRLMERLSNLVGPTGRPPAPAPEPAPQELATRLLGYLYDHPGTVSGSAQRRTYSRDFRLFVLEVIDAPLGVTLEAVARVIAVPLPTLKGWLRGEYSDSEPEFAARSATFTAKEAQISTLLEEYKRWEGNFAAFCDYVHNDLHLPFRRTALSTILATHDARRPTRRPGRSPDESALRESFETFFPNAQWVGDGSRLSIVINGERYAANLELMVDPYSGAFVGANLRPTEDADAVVAAFEDAQEATGETPIAVLLDNKPSNYTPEVVDAVAPAVVMRATLFRPQNKAHIEGGFGLLKPTLSELDITASTPKEFAWALLTLAVIVWGRTINHRPRRDRGGLSRAELLQDMPTAEEIAHAKERLAEIQRRQERARETRAARQDPVVRAYVAEALTRLRLEDPDGHFLTAIARYPLDAIVEAVSIFGGRQQAKSLPEGADARYLLGIARNTAQDREVWAIMDALWGERARAGDLVLRHLERKREELAANSSHPDALVDAYIDEAFGCPWQSERTYWLRAAASIIARAPSPSQASLYRRAARRVQATYSLSPRERLTAIRILADHLQPLR
jgi:hypothetical protein